MRQAITTLLACAGGWLLGCSGAEPARSTDASADGQTQLEAPPEGLSCTDADSVELGAAVSGKNGRVSARLVSADPWPAEPGSQQNDWVVQLLTPDGSPFSDATVVAASTFDRTHSTGGSPEGGIVIQAEPATFLLQGLRFVFLSRWDVLVAVTSPAGDDVITFPVCVFQHAASSADDAGDGHTPPPAQTATCDADSVGSIQAADYDRSCESDSDCVGVGEGSLCYACAIYCPTAAIRRSAQASYDADVAGSPAEADRNSLCFCPLLISPCCRDGQCFADSHCYDSASAMEASASPKAAL